MTNNETVVVTGGGTGGHLSVAKAFVDSLRAKRVNVIFIGSTYGQDMKWFKNDKKLLKAFFLDTRGVVNQSFFGKFESLYIIYKNLQICKEIFKQYGVKRVISVGGYSAAPASIAAVLGEQKLFIHEQNSIRGKLNKILAPFSQEVFNSFDKDSLVKDYPVEEKFFNSARVRRDIKSIIFLGGSQGAKAINNFALEVAPLLKQHNINIIHQSGDKDYERVKKEYQNLEIEVDLFAFDTNLDKKMSQADFAISRSGASTLWELCANALPALFVPYPYAAANHQLYNANFLHDRGLGFVCPEESLSKEVLLGCLTKDIHKISHELTTSIHIDGSNMIIDAVLTLKT
jgi:UDP-N-acetylglucosamine--N-acetylmuramyl-(pentapeptide) pyrophosphoryl-undecaprenol N-acetylglucosamine transferase